MPLVNGTSYVKWHLPSSTSAEHRGRTNRVKDRLDRLVWRMITRDCLGLSGIVAFASRRTVEGCVRWNRHKNKDRQNGRGEDESWPAERMFVRSHKRH